jgi:hypothetical protein
MFGLAFPLQPVLPLLLPITAGRNMMTYRLPPLTAARDEGTEPRAEGSVDRGGRSSARHVMVGAVEKGVRAKATGR